MHDPSILPAGLPVPVDDGAARHLVGAALADVTLVSTSGTPVRLAELAGPTVLFFYPRTGVPGQPPNLGFAGESWDTIPGARGCTPQSCGFRDQHDAFVRQGVQVLGVSTQRTDFHRELRERLHVAYDFLSDSELALTRAMRLPTFEFPVESGGPNTLMRRMSWLVLDGRIEQLWYPVFPPGENAARVLAFVERALPLYRGIEEHGVVYRREGAVGVAELGQTFARSGIRRPDADPDRLARMLRHASLVITARRDGELVGVARSLTDFSWCCYVSDLAVTSTEQHHGIGRRLLEHTRAAVGPECTVLLSAAPEAEAYYPRVGFEPIPSAWMIRRTE
jgi:peroxiredoxin